jgi:hypothetical protein
MNGAVGARTGTTRALTQTKQPAQNRFLRHNRQIGWFNHSAGSCSARELPCNVRAMFAESVCWRSAELSPGADMADAFDVGARPVTVFFCKNE